jgi:hypothetical protein
MVTCVKATEIESVLDVLNNAAKSFYKLVLLVGASGSGKTAVLQVVSEKCNAPLKNINLELSQRLLDLAPKKRPLKIIESIDGIVGSLASPLILDNLEILFDKSLKLDPLRLLQDMSRNKIVLASWNGTFMDGKLSYAKVGHPEYRKYEIIDAQIVTLEES